MIGDRKKCWFKGVERTRKARGSDPISLGFCVPSRGEHNVIGGQSECNTSSGGLGSETLSPLELLFPERLDSIEGGRCLPLKVETHALFRYAPRRQDPSFSFAEVIRKGMEDGPLRACLRLPGEDGRGRQKAGQYRMIPRRLKSSLPERFYSSRWLWHMTVELFLDGRVCLLPLVTHWACLCGRIGSRLERSLDRRNESIGPPITTVIREVIERRLAALSDCFRVPPDTD